MAESLLQIASRELESTTCAHCGDKKRRGESFCRSCYFSLPPKMRSALYTTFSDGYVTIYDETKAYLREQTPGDVRKQSESR